MEFIVEIRTCQSRQRRVLRPQTILVIGASNSHGQKQIDSRTRAQFDTVETTCTHLLFSTFVGTVTQRCFLKASDAYSKAVGDTSSTFGYQHDEHNVATERTV